jgi:hypothetical protein
VNNHPHNINRGGAQEIGSCSAIPRRRLLVYTTRIEWQKRVDEEFIYDRQGTGKKARGYQKFRSSKDMSIFLSFSRPKKLLLWAGHFVTKPPRRQSQINHAEQSSKVGAAGADY